VLLAGTYLRYVRLILFTLDSPYLCWMFIVISSLPISLFAEHCILQYVFTIIYRTGYIICNISFTDGYRPYAKKTFPIKRYGIWHFWSTFTVPKNVLYLDLNICRDLYIYFFLINYSPFCAWHIFLYLFIIILHYYITII